MAFRDALAARAEQIADLISADPPLPNGTVCVLDVPFLTRVWSEMHIIYEISYF
jgi:hypothetical protein